MLLNEDERLDDIHRNGYKVFQNKKKFCFGIDAVLLSDFAKGKKNNKVLDIGTGTGIVPILMYAKNPNTTYTAFELQKESSDLAMRSVKYNQLEDKIKIVNDDIKNVENYFSHGYFDVITTNPPYMSGKSGKINDFDEKAIARHEIHLSLDDLINYSEKMLKFGGHLYMVHRPNRLAEIFYVMKKYKIEPKVIRMVCPKENSKPNIVLIDGVKGGNPSLEVLPNLIVYGEDGNYTAEVNKIHYE